MAAHFLLSPAAKTINLVRVARMSKEEAETTFAAIRWAATNGKLVCPHCGCLNAYECRRPNGAPRFRCREGVRSGLLAHVRHPIRLPQDAPTDLPPGDRDLRQRGQGQDSASIAVTASTRTASGKPSSSSASATATASRPSSSRRARRSASSRLASPRAPCSMPTPRPRGMTFTPTSR